MTELLSPQMGKDIVWFLRRWAKTYLLVDEKLYEQVGASHPTCPDLLRLLICSATNPHLSPPAVDSLLVPSPQISIPLSTAFGADTEGAQWIVGYLLEKVINNLSVWSSETELANDTVELLVTLVEKRER